MKPIYIEVADEVTTVIERIREFPGEQVALVVPKGAILLQSIVNLKLARKAAQESGTQLTVVTTDKIGRNLASQVGLAVRSKADGPDEAASASEGEVLPGVKVHRYYDQGGDEPDAPQASVAPIIPRSIVRPGQPASSPAPDAAEAQAAETPITMRALEITLPAPRAGLPVIEIIRPRKTQATEAAEYAPALPVPAPAPAISLAPAAQGGQPATTQATAVAGNRLRKVPRPLVFAIYLLVLATLVAGGIAAVYWPKTVVTVHLHKEVRAQDLTLTAKTGDTVNANSLTVPALALSASSSDSATFAATGTKEVGDTATGTVQLRNFTDSDPQALPAGATLTAGGQNFVTTQSATVPGFRRTNGQDTPGTASVAIKADGPGPAGNLTADTVAITSPSTHLNAVALSTAGGTSKQVKVVTQGDIAAARTALLAKLTDAAKAQLTKQAGDQHALADAQSDQATTDKMTPSVLPDTQADTGQLTGQVTARRLGIRQSDLEQLAQARLSKDIDPQHTLASTSAAASSVSCTQESCVVKVTATATLVANVNLQPLAKKLAGTATANGLDLLRSSAPDADFGIERHPSWWPNHNFPPSAKYVSIVVKHD